MKRIFTHLLLLAAMVGCNMEIPKSPVAKFTVANAGCQAPCNVVFTSTSENATSVEWDLDDGSPIRKEPSFTYRYEGGKNYRVKLVALSAEAGSHGVMQIVEIKAKAESNPVANFDFTLDSRGIAPARATFLNRSVDAERYKWNFGDQYATTANPNESTLQAPTHLYTKPGVYKVTLIAINAANKESIAFEKEVKVESEAPVANFTVGNDNCEAPCKVTFTNTSTGGGTEYTWDFGGKGSSTDKSSEFTFTEAGDYAVKLVVKSADGKTDEKIIIVKIRQKTVSANAFSISGTYNLPTHMIADAVGNIYICGAMAGSADFGNGKTLSTGDGDAAPDFYIAKFNPSGQCLWAYTDGSSGADQANGLALDDGGNVYLTGVVGGTPRKTGGMRGGFVTKFSGNGEQRWFESFGGVEGVEGRSLAFYRTNSGPKVYVAGTIRGTAGERNIFFGGNRVSADAQDVFLIFYDSETGSAGQPLIVGGPNSQSLTAMVIDNEGSAYLTGSFDGVMTFSGSQGRLGAYGRSDAFVAKWSLRTGDWVWANKMGTSDDDYGYDLVVDNSKNVYTTGTFKGWMEPLAVGTTGDMGVYIAKWNADGSIHWGRSGFNNGLDDYAGGIAIGPGGNVIVAGSFERQGEVPFGNRPLVSNGSLDMIIGELHHSNDNGAHTGRFQASGGGSGQERAIRVCVAPDGTVYNTGWFTGRATFNGTELNSGNSRNTYIVKYKY